MLDYTKALQINDKMTDAYYNRARITLSRKDIENPDINKAVSDLEHALELDDKFVDAMYAMAAAYKKLGDYHKALVYLEKLLKIEPDAVNAKALKKLILAIRQQSYPGEAAPWQTYPDREQGNAPCIPEKRELAILYRVRI